MRILGNNSLWQLHQYGHKDSLRTQPKSWHCLSTEILATSRIVLCSGHILLWNILYIYEFRVVIIPGRLWMVNHVVYCDEQKRTDSIVFLLFVFIVASYYCAIAIVNKLIHCIGVFETIVVISLVKKFPPFMEPDGSLACSQEPAWGPTLSFSNMLIFFTVRSCEPPAKPLRWRTTPLSIIFECVFNIFGVTLCPPPEDAV
jgi:hypothetical protein